MSRVIKQYEMESQITQEMMQKWGYSKRQALNNRKKRVSVNGFNILQLRPFRRISQSFDTNHQQKPKTYGQHKNYLKQTEGLFKEFNYVVGQKHSKAKKKVIEIRNPEPPSEIEIIEQQIKQAQQDIKNNPYSNDLENQFNLNNKINKLFKKYHKANKQRVKTCSFRQSRGNSFDSKVFRDQHRHKIPKQNYEFTKERKRAQSLLEPFEKIYEDSFVESKKIQTKISQQNEVIQLYKNKVDEIRKNAMKQYRSEQQIQLPDLIQNNVVVQNQPIYQVYDMKITKTNHQVDFDKLAESKERKQKVFTKILKNKNAKFVREKGTNCLIRYNEKQEAKQLLSGKMKPNRKSSEEMDKRENTQSTDDYDIAVMAGPPMKIPDNRDYEAQFRNQKAQASLRFKRKRTLVL